MTAKETALWHDDCSGARPNVFAKAKGGLPMLLFAIGLMAGVALGMIIVGFLAIGAYDRGHTDALERRKAWRGELIARQVVAARTVAAARKAS